MWNAKPNERLNEWRDFRLRINELEFKEAIDQTVTLWSYAPFINTYLSGDLIEDWPSPWILVYDNQYDDLSIALGMLYTLVLTDFDAKYEIKILKEEGTNEIFNTVWINEGEYVLNYEYNEPVAKNKLPSNLITLYEYNETDLKLNNL